MCSKLESAEINNQGSINNIPSTGGTVISKLISNFFLNINLCSEAVVQRCY